MIGSGVTEKCVFLPLEVRHDFATLKAACVTERQNELGGNQQPAPRHIEPRLSISHLQPMNGRRGRSVGPETSNPRTFSAGQGKHQSVLAGVLVPRTEVAQ